MVGAAPGVARRRGGPRNEREVVAVYGVLGGVVVVGGSLLLTLLAVVVVRRLVSHQTLARHNDVAGFVYATTGVTYAVVLAFVVIAVWENYADAREVADREASAMGVLFRLSNGFPDPHRAAAQEALLGYAEAAVEEEWPAMEDGEAPSPKTSQALDDLFAVYARPDFVAAVNPEQYGESLAQMNEVSVARRGRVLASHSGLPSVLWVVLLGGGVLVVAFAFLFGVESPYSQAAIMGALTVTIAMLLYVVADAQHPFRGGFTVKPEGLESVLAQFGHAGGPTPAPTATPTP
ncbi:MAG TPA: hypothetical protein VH482_34095 [Thermomicrobiales bacterium]